MTLRAHALVLAIGTTTLSSSALAQGYDELGSYDGQGFGDSRQDAAVEARLGPYRPDVDNDVAGAPFEGTFGNKRRYAFGLQGDWQAFRIPAVGTVGPGLGWSYVRFSAKAPLADGTGRSPQDTRLWIMPFVAQGVLRIDTLAKNLSIPFVPFAKLGLVYALWGCSTGDSGCRAEDGTRGRGSETGYQYALGLMFLLDWMDPYSAKEMDNSVGVNNSYFFGEWYASDVDSFGEGLQVGTNTWALGLAFEF